MKRRDLRDTALRALGCLAVHRVAELELYVGDVSDIAPLGQSGAPVRTSAA